MNQNDGDYAWAITFLRYYFNSWPHYEDGDEQERNAEEVWWHENEETMSRLGEPAILRGRT